MTIRHLRVFLAVCRAQSVTQAAQTLHVTQPAVSRAVQELERHYGVRLFERLNHRLFLTESGRELYQQALHAVEAFDRMEQSMRSWEEDGVLRVGAGVTLGATLLPRAAAEMQRRHSRLRLTAQVANGETLRRALLQGELDLALVEDGAAQPPLERRVLADDCLTPLLPPDDPRAGREVPLEALAAGPLLLRERGSSVRDCVEQAFARQRLPLEARWESVSSHALLEAVHEGLGLSFLPQRLAAEALRRGDVAACTVTDESFRRRQYVIWHRNKFLDRLAQEFIDCCGQLTAQD